MTKKYSSGTNNVFESLNGLLSVPFQCSSSVMPPPNSRFDASSNMDFFFIFVSWFTLFVYILDKLTLYIIS